MQLMGIDIGGTGIKGGIVDVTTGTMLTGRHKILTPKPSRPKAIANTVKELVKYFNYSGPIGIGFPAIVEHGIAMSAGNIDKSNFGVDIKSLFSHKLKEEVFVLNDADAAGVAEMRFGAGKGKSGKVVCITIGTGLGSGLFYNGSLIPNLELGRLLYKDLDLVERWVSEAVRKREGMTYEKFGKRFNIFLEYADSVLSPDLIILGGGGGKKLDKFKKCIKIEKPIVKAKYLNEAGTVGAALAAFDVLKTR